MNTKIVAMWNSGLELPQAIVFARARGISEQEVTSCFNAWERKYGSSCISISDVYGPSKKTIEDSKYLMWKGEIGPGALLRNIIKEERKQK